VVWLEVLDIDPSARCCRKDRNTMLSLLLLELLRHRLLPAHSYARFSQEMQRRGASDKVPLWTLLASA
jgi:hypothetical protein